MEQRARLLGDRVGDLGMRVTERRDREAAEEVEVLLARRCPRGACPRRARTRPAARPYVCITCSASSARDLRRESVDRPRFMVSHHRADALAGEELEQQRVRDAAVEDVGAGARRCAARATHDAIFGIMPSSNLPVARRAPRARRRRSARSATLVVRVVARTRRRRR